MESPLMASLTVHDLAVLACATLWACMAVGLAGVALQAQGWRQGRAASTPWLQGLLQLPRRYLVNVHAVVANHRQTAWMHAMLAGGFLASLAGWCLLPWIAMPIWLALQASALIVMIAGVVLLGLRRLPRARTGVQRRPQRLSRGRFRWLPIAFAAYAAGSLLLLAFLAEDASRQAGAISTAAAVLVMAAMLYLIGGICQQPLRHAVFGALYLAAHPKPARFAPDTHRRLTSADAALPSARAAVGQTQDFSWKQLLSFDACVECGRCEAVCPAHATGHALNPKALIQDLVRVTHLRDEPYTGQPHGASDAGGGASLMGITPETLWSCTTCAACVNACPMFIEHVDVITDLRRHLTQERGAMPGKLPTMMRQIRESGNSHGRPPGHRWSWATDLALRELGDTGQADVLVWAGDAGFEPHGQQTLRALLDMLTLAGVDYAVLGAQELDCGHLSRRCGDEAAFVQLRDENMRTLSRYRFSTLLTTDPHAFHTLRDEYPAGAWQVMHHTAYLAQLIEQGRLAPRRAQQGTVVFHDACYLGRYGQVYDAPRDLLRHSGLQLLEAPRSRDSAFCCGAGGGQAWAGQPSLTSIPIMRFEELAATGAQTLAVGCPNCKIMLQGAAGERVMVRDVAELLRASL